MNQIPSSLPDSPKGIFDQTRILHLAITAGAMMLLGVVFFLKSDFSTDPNPELDDIFRVIVPLMIIAGVGVGLILKNRFLQSLTSETSAIKKLTGFRSFLIIQLAACDAGAILAAIATLLTGRGLYLIEGIGVVIWMALQFPLPDALIQMLHLSPEEGEQLQPNTP